MFGTLGATARDQGSPLLLNLHFGPNINTAYTMSNQLSNTANLLANAISQSFSPEMSASEGRGERHRTLSLAQRANKFGTLCTMFFAIPLFIEADYVLTLWLTTPPAYTAEFCRLMLLAFLLDRLTQGHLLAVNAHGRIAAYQSTLGTCMLLALPLVWLFLRWQYPPTSAGVIFIAIAGIISAGRLLWAKHLLKASVSNWAKEVLLPCAIIAAITFSCSLAIKLTFKESFARMLGNGLATSTIMILSIWLLALQPVEKEFILMFFQKLWRKITNSAAD